MSYGWTAGLGTMLAIGLAALTCGLTRTVEWRNVPRETEALSHAAEELQIELDRLYTRYVDRLENLAAEVEATRGISLTAERSASGLMGVRTLTLLGHSVRGNEMHREIRQLAPLEQAFEKKAFPIPTFSAESGDDLLRVDPSDFASAPSARGWYRASPDQFYYWKRIGNSGVIFIGIDVRSIREAINVWLIEREDLAFHVIPNGTGAFTRLSGPRGRVLLETGVAPEPARLGQVFPATIRFGTWQIQAWGAAEKVIQWNRPFLGLGLGFSLVLFGGSVMTANAMWRTHRLARQRVSFVNQASHELRTPITNLMLNIDLVDELVKEDPDAARERLLRVTGEASRLSRLVDNLLTFSGSEAQADPVVTRALDPIDVIDDVLAQFEISLVERGIETVWHNRERHQVIANRDALAQVMANLISNVEKYAAGGRCLEISPRVSGKTWCVDVSDHGPGIRDPHTSRIFEAFYREKSDVCEGGSGTGLGLTIARDLAQRMNGDLTLEASQGGATFRLSLKLAE